MKTIKTTLAILCCLFMLSKTATCDSNQVGSPLTASQTSGTSGGSLWNYIDYIKLYDGSPANCNLGIRGYSATIKATNFDFHIPATATIKGYKVRITKGGYHGYVKDSKVMLYMGSEIGSNKSKSSGYTTYPIESYYGGPTDTWGVTLSAFDVNSSDFGVVFKCWNTDYASSQYAYVDYISMTVYYSIGAREFEQTNSGIIAEADAKVGPNPANAFLELQINKDMSQAEIQLVNLTGQVVYESIPANIKAGEPVRLDISTYENGVYFLRINSNDELITKQFIKR